LLDRPCCVDDHAPEPGHRLWDGYRRLAAEARPRRYEPAFRENKIDGEILPRLTAEDLKDLGVALVGDRRRLLEAIGSLREEAAAASVATMESPGANTRMIAAAHQRLMLSGASSQ